MTTTRTTYLTAPRSIQMAEQGPLAPAPGEALIELTAVGVCGSDLHWYLDGQIGESKLREPLTLGHEPAGRVLAVGAGGDPSLVGKHVAIEPAIHCGGCRWCLRGDTNICPGVKFIGTPPYQGAFREQMLHPASLLFPLPEGMSDELGALHEPLAIALHAMDLLKPRAAAPVMVQGAGPVGLSCCLALMNYGPAPLILMEPHAGRREFAKSLGIPYVLSPDDPDSMATVRRLTGGYGPDYIVEAAGTRQSFDQMVHWAAPGAKIAAIGIEPLDDYGFAHSPARRKGLTIYMVRRSRHTLERAIELTQKGWWRPQALLTHRMPLASLAQAMEMVTEKRDGVIKLIIQPDK